MKFEQKNFALSSNGYNFPLIVRRSIREFVEHDEQDGFYLSRLFSETHRLWLILIETNKRMAKSTQTKGRISTCSTWNMSLSAISRIKTSTRWELYWRNCHPLSPL